MENMARLLIALGISIIAIGLIFLAFSKMGGSGFRLPGDIYFKKGNFTFYFPIVTCLVISLVLTLIINLWSRR